MHYDQICHPSETQPASVSHLRPWVSAHCEASSELEQTHQVPVAPRLSEFKQTHAIWILISAKELARLLSDTKTLAPRPDHLGTLVAANGPLADNNTFHSPHPGHLSSPFRSLLLSLAQFSPKVVAPVHKMTRKKLE